MRVETLVVVHRDDRVLLGLKRKREGKSFGVGKWNGYGGGLEPEDNGDLRSEEHTSELQSHSFISYAVFCLKKKTKI